MRTKHAAKESTALYSPTNDPTLLVTHHLPFGKHCELRKHEGTFTAARAKSTPRSGSNTPRCVSETSSPKCDLLVKELDVETPRTYLIKDSFLEPECNKLTELLHPSPKTLGGGVGGVDGTGTCSLSRNVIACSSPVSAGNKFISEIAEVDWFYEGGRLVGGGTTCSSDRAWGPVEVEAKERFMSSGELRKLKGKEPVAEVSLAELVVAGKRGKAPMAFPTEGDVTSMCTGGSRRCLFETPERCLFEAPESSTVESEPRERDVSVPLDMPPWLRKAYETLTVIDDEQDNNSTSVYQLSERSGDADASSSRNWQWKAASEEALAEGEKIESLTSLREKFEAGQAVSCDDNKGEAGRMRMIFGEGIKEQEVLSKDVEDERKEQGQQGTGWLWKMSLCASVSFVTWVLMNGARIQCRSLFPTIREREQPVKILRRKPNKMYEVEET